uniref:DUF4283 domain-containing protein n=1 Tax=Solanum lycopersicum TaxID=4081 RepID=A0A3Q7JBA3_SOLLC
MHLVGVNATEIGALKVMEFLKKQLEDHNIYYGRYFTDKALREEAMGSSTAANFLHSCKMSCYVAQDYEAELSSKDSKLILVLPDDSNITLSVECFRTGEVLFRPYLARIKHNDYGRYMSINDLNAGEDLYHHSRTRLKCWMRYGDDKQIRQARGWANKQKKSFGVNIYELYGNMFLFELSNKFMLEQTLQGQWKWENLVFNLEWWIPTLVFAEIGQLCGGWVAIEEDTKPYEWARILVANDGRNISKEVSIMRDEINGLEPASLVFFNNITISTQPIFREDWSLKDTESQFCMEHRTKQSNIQEMSIISSSDVLIDAVLQTTDPKSQILIRDGMEKACLEASGTRGGIVMLWDGRIWKGE